MKLKSVLSALTLTGSLFFSHSGFADALDNWHWLNPLPTGNSLYGISFATNRFVAVGDAGTAVCSTNGVDWVASMSLTTNILKAVTYGNGLFVAVGNNGVIQTSPDGTNWISHPSGTTAALNAVTYGGGTFVAVGSGGTIIVSTNTVNWVSSASGVINNLGDVSYGNGVFVATCPTENLVLNSSNGISWTNQVLTYGGDASIGAYVYLRQLVFANGLFVAESRGTYVYGPFNGDYYPWDVFFSSTNGISWTTNLIAIAPTSSPGNFITYGDGIYLADGSPPEISTNGQTWTNAVLSGYASGSACAYGNGTFAMVGGSGSILTSTNGLAWTNRAPAGSQSLLTGVAFGNGTYVAVGSSAATILLSTNGFSYQSPPTPFTNDPLSSVMYTNGTFTAVGENGIIVQSSDGITWTQRNSSTSNSLHAVTAANGLLITVGDNGTIVTSPAGLVWTGRFSGTSEHLYAITYGDEMFVTVGYQGTILTSADGISWTAQYSGQLSDLCAVTYGDAGFIAVGAGGVIVTSPDGINWTIQNSGTSLDLYSISYGNGYYIAVGENVTLTSLDGIEWTARAPEAPENYLYGTAFINDSFFLVGGNGAILESDNTVPVPLSLQIHLETNGVALTIFAPLGSNFRLQACTSMAAPNWSDLATFTNVLAITQWSDMTTNPARFYRAVSP